MASMARLITTSSYIKATNCITYQSLMVNQSLISNMLARGFLSSPYLYRKQKDSIGISLKRNRNVSPQDDNPQKNEKCKDENSQKNDKPFILLPLNFFDKNGLDSKTVKSLIKCAEQLQAQEKSNCPSFAVVLPNSSAKKSKCASKSSEKCKSMDQLKRCFSSQNNPDCPKEERAVEAFVLCNENENETDSNCPGSQENENKIPLDLSNQVIEQLDCLGITGLNLNLCLEYSDFKDQIERAAKCQIIKAGPCPPKEDETIEIPVEIDTKITGKLDLCIGKLKQLDEFTPEELNSRISTVTSAVTLKAIECSMECKNEKTSSTGEYDKTIPSDEETKCKEEGESKGSYTDESTQL